MPDPLGFATATAAGRLPAAARSRQGADLRRRSAAHRPLRARIPGHRDRRRPVRLLDAQRRTGGLLRHRPGLRQPPLSNELLPRRRLAARRRHAPLRPAWPAARRRVALAPPAWRQPPEPRGHPHRGARHGGEGLAAVPADDRHFGFAPEQPGAAELLPHAARRPLAPLARPNAGRRQPVPQRPGRPERGADRAARHGCALVPWPNDAAGLPVWPRPSRALGSPPIRARRDSGRSPPTWKARGWPAAFILPETAAACGCACPMRRCCWARTSPLRRRWCSPARSRAACRGRHPPISWTGIWRLGRLRRLPRPIAQRYQAERPIGDAESPHDRSRK